MNRDVRSENSTDRKKTVSVNLDARSRELLDQLSDDEDRSKSGVVRRAIAEYAEQEGRN
jgi:predicted transcriptional regulator